MGMEKYVQLNTYYIAKKALDRGVQLKQVMAEFVKHDTDTRDGEITLSEMKKYWENVAKALKSGDVAIECVKDEINSARKIVDKKKVLLREVELLFNEMDTNKSGRVEIQEFMAHAGGSGKSVKTILDNFVSQNTELNDGTIQL